MALERGDVIGIVNAVFEGMQPVLGEVEKRLEHVESRIAAEGPGSEGVEAERAAELERLEQVEAATSEIVSWSAAVNGAMTDLAQQMTEMQAAQVRLLAGGSTAEWRAFVVREGARLGGRGRELLDARRVVVDEKMVEVVCLGSAEQLEHRSLHRSRSTVPRQLDRGPNTPRVPAHGRSPSPCPPRDGGAAGSNSAGHWLST